MHKSIAVGIIKISIYMHQPNIVNGKRQIWAG